MPTAKGNAASAELLPLPALLLGDRRVGGTDAPDEERRVRGVVQVQAEPKQYGAVARRDRAKDLGGGAAAGHGRVPATPSRPVGLGSSIP
ncbi:hypothetical protein [Sorangium sp. So ce887]|uniref:hypothetical protein n=1 Tax=Sorangium sp. So ce887 TaxID=3133324 RepID=UPI003F61AC1C